MHSRKHLYLLRASALCKPLTAAFLFLSFAVIQLPASASAPLCSQVLLQTKSLSAADYTEIAKRMNENFPEAMMQMEDASIYVNAKDLIKPLASLEEMSSLNWSEYTGYFVKSSITAILGPRFKTLDPEIQNTMLAVHNKFTNKEAFIQYMERLSLETMSDIERRGNPTELASLKQGIIPETALLKVLVRRSKERGDGRISVILDASENGRKSLTRKSDTHDDFRNAVQQGPFLDMARKDKPHGMATHLLQRDFVADVINTTMHGNPQKFWDYLGTKEGVNYWVPIFDTYKDRTLGNPEFLRSVARIYVKMR